MHTDADYVRFFHICLPRLGLRWAGFRKVRKQVVKRLKRRLRALQLPHPAAYLAYLDRHPEEWGVLDSCCRIVISRFYRDQGLFETLRDAVLPTLAHAVRARQAQTLRCWSAGCAAGEEVYTLTLLWQLCLQAQFPDLRLHIIATDIDANALARARRGCYEWGSVKALPSRWLEAGLERRDHEYCVRETFREGICFVAQDIRQDLPEGDFDLVLCRNLVCTYFAEALQCKILAQIAERLVPGGVLVLGAHETLPPNDVGLVAYPGHQSMVQKLARVPSPAPTPVINGTPSRGHPHDPGPCDSSLSAP
jgi:chemotaxis protein methyltransferase CheR